MQFTELKAEDQRVAVSTIDYAIDNVYRAANALAELIAVPDGNGRGEVKGASLVPGEVGSLHGTVLGKAIVGRFEVVKAGDSLGGRYTFYLINKPVVGDETSEAIFSIEFDSNWRLRFGTEGDFTAMVQAPQGHSWAIRRRLLGNLVSIVYQRLETIPV